MSPDRLLVHLFAFVPQELREEAARVEERKPSARIVQIEHDPTRVLILEIGPNVPVADDQFEGLPRQIHRTNCKLIPKDYLFGL